MTISRVTLEAGGNDYVSISVTFHIPLLRMLYKKMLSLSVGSGFEDPSGSRIDGSLIHSSPIRKEIQNSA